MGTVGAIKGKTEVGLGESPEGGLEVWFLKGGLGGTVGENWKMFCGCSCMSLGIHGEIGSRTPPCVNTKIQGCASSLYKMA